MNTKGQQNEILSFVIGGGVMMLVIGIGVFAISGGVADSPDLINDSKLSAFNNTFNKYVQYESEISNLQEQTTTLDASGGGTFGFINDLINRGWNLIKGIWGTFGFLTDSIRALDDWIPIPPFIVILIVSMISAVFVFKLLTLIFNRDV